jgi:hypothetical protein
MEPAAPEFMALSMGTISPPSTSPTMARLHRPPDQIGAADATDVFHLGLSRFQCDHLVMAVGEAVGGEFVVGLHRDQAFLGGNVAGEGAEKGGLTVAHAAGGKGASVRRPS